MSSLSSTILPTLKNRNCCYIYFLLRHVRLAEFMCLPSNKFERRIMQRGIYINVFNYAIRCYLQVPSRWAPVRVPTRMTSWCPPHPIVGPLKPKQSNDQPSSMYYTYDQHCVLRSMGFNNRLQ